MTSEHVGEELTGFISGNLDAETSGRIRAHLSGCQTCRSEFLAMNALWESLGQLPDETPDESVRARFYDMLKTYERTNHPAAVRPKMAGDGWFSRLFPRRPIVQFALTLAAAAIGILLGYQFKHEHTDGAELTQLHQEVIGMSRLLAMSLLQQQSASERLRGVSLSYQIAEPDAEITKVLLETLKYDPNVNVRLAALDALSRNAFQSDTRRDLIQSLHTQSSPLVQMAMIDLIVQMQDKASLDTLRRMIKDPELNKAVKKKIEQGIEQLS
jgi:hypothetical protein